MGWFTWVGRRLDVLFRKDSVEDELADEIRFHVEMEARSLIELGMDPRKARRKAMRDFGGVERVKEEVRDVRGARVLDDFLQDSGVALRSLPKQPAFLLAVLLTLGIGIGGNVAMFGVLERSVFQALPYPDYQDLVMGRVTYEGDVGVTVSGPDFFDYRDQSASFESLAAITPFSLQATVTGGGSAERVQAPMVSAGFFETFGLAPAAGRFFLAEEGEPGGAPVAVLSHGYWQRRFAGDPSVVGGTIVVDGRATTVVGVAAEGFRFLLDADIWRPFLRGQGMASARQFHNFLIVGRLASGAAVGAAQAEVDAISVQLAGLYPDTNRDKGLNISPLRDALTGQYRQPLNILVAAVAMLLLIACANVAGLLLARGSSRRAELAVRSVMGAGRQRLARQLLTENVYLALGAGVIGVLLASWIQRGMLIFMPMESLGPIEAGVSIKTLAFALLMSAVTVLLFGVFPSLRVARTDPAGDLRGAGRNKSAARTSRFRSGLVVAQVAMTFTLLVVSGLLIRSFSELMQVDSGFDSGQLLTAEVAVPRAEYPDPGAAANFFTELEDRVATLPGVTATALISHLPIQDPGGNIRVARPEDFGSDGVFGTLADRRSVMPGYFETLGIPQVQGRDVAATDDSNSPPVIVLSAGLAEELFGDERAIGQFVGVDQGSADPALREVIGVVGDVKTGSLAEGDEFAMYYPFHQSPSARMRLAVRTRGDGAGIVTGIRETLRTMNPNVPLEDITTMDEAIRQSVSNERTIAIVLVLFAGVALLLSGVGLYGVLAYRVTRRFHEIGVRIALGASVRSVTSGIVAGGLRLAVLGLFLGVPGAWIAGRFLEGMLFGVQPTDPLTLATVAGFLALVATLASLFPARRAARIDPVEAFRAE